MAERTMRIYGALDLVFAWVYLLSFIYAVPPYSDAVKVAVYVVCIMVMIGGVGLILARRWGYFLGLAAAGVLLAVCVFTVLTLVAAAAYLHGLYGAFGKGATYVTLFGISLVVAYMGLLPAFQLHALLRGEVRTRFIPGRDEAGEKATGREGQGKVTAKEQADGGRAKNREGEGRAGAKSGQGEGGGKGKAEGRGKGRGEGDKSGSEG